MDIETENKLKIIETKKPGLLPTHNVKLGIILLIPFFKKRILFGKESVHVRGEKGQRVRENPRLTAELRARRGPEIIT